MIKKIQASIPFLLAGVMLLTSCSSAGNSAPAADPAPAPVETPAAPAPAPAAPEAPAEPDALPDTGKMVLYTAASDSEIELTVPYFEELTGIEVELVTGGVGELLKRIEAEASNPLGDVLLGGTRTSNISSANLFQEYISPETVNLIEGCQHEDGHFTSYSQTALCMIVNNNLIGEIKLEGYADLLNPELKGKIAYADPAASSNAFTLLMNMLYVMGDGDIWSDKAWNFIDEFCTQLDGKVLSSSSATPRGVADGEYTVGLTHEVYTATYIKEGAPVKAVYFQEGTFVSEEVASIIENCPNPKSAQLFMDFLLSEDQQNRKKDEKSARPARVGVEAPSGMAATDQLNAIPEIDVSNEDKAAVLEKFNDLLNS